LAIYKDPSNNSYKTRQGGKMKYQLVLQFPAKDETDFNRLLDLEKEMEIHIGNDHEVDGHDFGCSEMNIFIHTDDVEAAFFDIQKVVSINTFPGLKVAYRLLEAEEYTLLWPKEKGGTFSVL
jgi:hypothetical protein